MSSQGAVQHAYSSLAQPYIDQLGSMNVVHPDDQRLIEDGSTLGGRAAQYWTSDVGPGT